MTIIGFGVQLRRMTLSDIERIRTWRNAPEIQALMFEQANISADQQEKWFETVNNDLNYFFLIEVEHKPVGLIYAKNLDAVTLEGEGGIFMGEPTYRTSDIPARASLLWLWVCFEYFGFDTSRIKVKRENAIALAYNAFLGYQLNREEGEMIGMELTKAHFMRSKGMRMLKTFRFDLDRIQIVGEPSELNLPIINSFLRSQR